MSEIIAWTLAAFISGFLAAAMFTASAYDNRDATRVKIGFMSTRTGAYKLTEIKP